VSTFFLDVVALCFQTSNFKHHLLFKRVKDWKAVCIVAYLEASTQRSAGLYARHGFIEVGVVEFAPGVALRPMVRDPA